MWPEGNEAGLLRFWTMTNGIGTDRFPLSAHSGFPAVLKEQSCT